MNFSRWTSNDPTKGADYHQGRDWKHYTRFRERAKDPQLRFDFMVFYDDTYRKKSLAIPTRRSTRSSLRKARVWVSHR
ncbi:BZ3500_MvSof-1268-A1-R1_Chr4-1g06719 [Microbotryum saponariae]|uniref:BZ3500_MvSof-1268-A1-R1_Chr4-1g06719 protein n=1 Tax=Microbotryum saponariae TaxID=289078 RepID=A0A2X0KXY2_9BASI|nr:BZ3500_MvSof-1268-A1-R1_Chr4-1g06719 [Microbotryum saponariae]SDA06384.1 BZ3501_MvSof-1269-A2-R1_Chr4-1g06429 [Microbotryum saponariae]